MSPRNRSALSVEPKIALNIPCFGSPQEHAGERAKVPDFICAVCAIKLEVDIHPVKHVVRLAQKQKAFERPFKALKATTDKALNVVSPLGKKAGLL